MNYRIILDPVPFPHAYICYSEASPSLVNLLPQFGYGMQSSHITVISANYLRTYFSMALAPEQFWHHHYYFYRASKPSFVEFVN